MWTKGDYVKAALSAAFPSRGFARAPDIHDDDAVTIYFTHAGDFIHYKVRLYGFNKYRTALHRPQSAFLGILISITKNIEYIRKNTDGLTSNTAHVLKQHEHMPPPGALSPRVVRAGDPRR